MVRSAKGFRGLARIALAAGAVLGAAAFGATGAAAHERYYYAPAPVYYAPPVYYVPAPAPAPVYGASVLELMFSLGDNDRGGNWDRGHDRGRHNGWSHGRGHDRD